MWLGIKLLGQQDYHDLMDWKFTFLQELKSKENLFWKTLSSMSCFSDDGDIDVEIKKGIKPFFQIIAVCFLF